MGMRLADEQPDQRRRYAQGKLMLQREAEPPLARESEGAVAQAAERPAADEEDIKDLGAAEVAMDDQADEPEAEEAKPDAFVTILIRVVYRGDRAEAQEEAATESAPAAEEPAE
jgi:IMP dehydrogenase/GMP reductase